MKKIVTFMSLILLLVSCGTTKVQRQARRTFDGSWTLTKITYPENSGTFNVTLFNDASASCFENSSWNFISNNNSGTYTVSGTNCSAGERYFKWSVDAENPDAGMYDFLLKPTNSEYNSTTGGTGFRLNLVNLTETTMVWEQSVSLDGEPFVIRMNFTKY